VLFTEEDRSKVVGGLPGLGRCPGVSPGLVPGAVSPGCQQQRFQSRSVQIRISCWKQDRVHVVASLRQLLADAIATGQAGCHDRDRRNHLIGKELPSQQVRTVPDPEHLFEDFAALIGGLTRQPVEEVERSVVAERAGTEGAYVSLAIDGDAASPETQ